MGGGQLPCFNFFKFCMLIFEIFGVGDVRQFQTDSYEGKDYKLSWSEPNAEGHGLAWVLFNLTGT